MDDAGNNAADANLRAPRSETSGQALFLTKLLPRSRGPRMFSIYRAIYLARIWLIRAVPTAVVFFVLLTLEAIALALVSIVVFQGLKLINLLLGQPMPRWWRAWGAWRIARNSSSGVRVRDMLHKARCPGSKKPPRSSRDSQSFECAHCWYETDVVNGRVAAHLLPQMHLGAEPIPVVCDPRIATLTLREWRSDI